MGSCSYVSPDAMEKSDLRSSGKRTLERLFQFEVLKENTVFDFGVADTSGLVLLRIPRCNRELRLK